jgi:hypothetical protein
MEQPTLETLLQQAPLLIERFFAKLKPFRRVATRYDKLGANFLAMIQLASMRLWLQAYESTAYAKQTLMTRSSLASCYCTPT